VEFLLFRAHTRDRGLGLWGGGIQGLRSVRLVWYGQVKKAQVHSTVYADFQVCSCLTVTGKEGFGSTAGYADVSFVLYVCHCIYNLGGGICLGCGIEVVVEDAGWIDFFEGLGYDLAHGLSDQHVGSDGWRQSTAMGGFRHLLWPELRGIS